MRLQKRKNWQKISLFLPTAENPEQALKKGGAVDFSSTAPFLFLGASVISVSGLS